MTKPAIGNAGLARGDLAANAERYKKDFWATENLKFREPWYRLEKSARLIGSLAHGEERTLLDVGCGPATLGRLVPPNILYYGIDIAIHQRAINLREYDILESQIAFDGRKFDFVVAQGLFEYVGNAQSQKLAEIADILNPGGKLVLTYTNFAHRKARIYPVFSNVQPLERFAESVSERFVIERFFPASHNWKHGQPARRLVKAVNMYINFNVPLISSILAVEYFFICAPRAVSGHANRGVR